MQASGAHRLDGKGDLVLRGHTWHDLYFSSSRVKARNWGPAGVPVGLDHDGANRNDHKLLKGTLDSIPIERPQPTVQQPQGICLDKAYDNQEVRDTVSAYGLTPHIRARGEEIDLKAHNPEWKARRWVVEACHSWMNRNRGILIRWSKKDENHLALLQLSSGLIAFKKAHHPTLNATQPG